MVAGAIICRHCGAVLFPTVGGNKYEHSTGWISCNYHATEIGLPAKYGQSIATPWEEEDTVDAILIKYYGTQV